MNTVSLLLFTILFLGPGLGFYIGIFLLSGTENFRPAPPRPGSIITISTVVIGALGFHALFALVFLLNDWFANSVKQFATMPFDPNVYELLYSKMIKGGVLPRGSIAYVLIILFIVSILSLFLTAFVISKVKKNQRFDRFFYGWLDQIVRQSSPENCWATAFVLTQEQFDGKMIGYEGIVKDITLDSSKQLQAITLIEVERFLLCAYGNTFRRLKAYKPPPLLPSLYLPGERISNIAFTVVEAISDDAPVNEDAKLVTGDD